jgi:hypothetical protein
MARSRSIGHHGKSILLPLGWQKDALKEEIYVARKRPTRDEP